MECSQRSRIALEHSFGNTTVIHIPRMEWGLLGASIEKREEKENTKKYRMIYHDHLASQGEKMRQIRCCRTELSAL